MPYYIYCMEYGINPFIDLNRKRGHLPVYKDDFQKSIKKLLPCYLRALFCRKIVNKL